MTKTGNDIKKDLKAIGVECKRIPQDIVYCNISLDGERGGVLFYHTDDQLIKRGQKVLDFFGS